MKQIFWRSFHNKLILKLCNKKILNQEKLFKCSSVLQYIINNINSDKNA